jgi:tight adherence protein C
MAMLLAILGVVIGGFGAGLVAFELLAQREAKQRKELLKERIRAQPAELEALEGKPASRFEKLPFAGSLLKRDRQTRQQTLFEYELPQMLESIALGLQAGRGFDQAFGLYVQRFDTALASKCQPYHEVWSRGLRSREEGMQSLAASIESTAFTRFVAITLRAIKYGAPLADVLLQLAADTRKECNAAMQERIAKAPVKMLLPTGVLILPAMMLLVLGPILLDLVRQMG